MPQYCDSAKLEQNWYYWLIASSVPCLESHRKQGILWTKITGKVLDNEGKLIVKGGKTFPNAIHPERLHCVLTDNNLP